MTNEEHRMKNDIEVHYSRNSETSQLRFLFFLLLLTQFSQNPSMLNLGTLYLTSLTPINRKKNGIWWTCSSPRRAVASSWSKLAHWGELVPSPPKQFGGLGEPEASLGKMGSRKLLEMTLLPLPLVIFRILAQNIERSHILCRNWCWTTPFG